MSYFNTFSTLIAVAVISSLVACAEVGDGDGDGDYTASSSRALSADEVNGVLVQRDSHVEERGYVGEWGKGEYDPSVADLLSRATMLDVRIYDEVLGITREAVVPSDASLDYFCTEGARVTVMMCLMTANGVAIAFGGGVGDCGDQIFVGLYHSNLDVSTLSFDDVFDASAMADLAGK